MLPRVINNSSSLTLPGVRVDNLASHVLSLALSRLAADWHTRYNTTLVSVGDREADIYELFDEAGKSGNGPKLLVRAKHNRKLQDEQGRLWVMMKAREVEGIQVLGMPRQGSRAARCAKMEIRYAQSNLHPPKGWRRARNTNIMDRIAALGRHRCHVARNEGCNTSYCVQRHGLWVKIRIWIGIKGVRKF